MSVAEPDLTIWATPAVIDDPARPDQGVIPLLTLVPSIMVHTSDPHTGAEQLDVIAASLLRAGFAPLPSIDPSALSALPALPHWHALLRHDGRHLQIIQPSGTLYDGDLGASPPPAWHPAVHRRRSLVVLVANGVDLTTPDSHDQIQYAARDGRIVGAHLPLVVAPGPT